MSVEISVVSPVYGCAESLEKLCLRLKQALESLSVSYEIILVNDASPDHAWKKIEDLTKQYSFVKGINLSRNFGQHYAITAGLAHISGNWCIVMDCDLQDKPEEIHKLYNQAKQGYDIVFAQRIIRKDNFFRRFSSKAFYKFFGYMTDTKMDSSIANFGIYHKKSITAILSMKDYIRYFPAMAQWVGFSKAYIEVDHNEREMGRSSYSLKKLLKLASDNILSFSDKPLRLIVNFGFFIAFIAVLVACFYLVLYLNGKITQPGYTSLIISIWFLGGLIIFSLGLVGIYIGKIFDTVKSRPVYIIKDKINF